MATIDTEIVTEDEAIMAYHQLARRFGWNGTFFTRSDAESSWNEYHEQDEPLTDEVWGSIENSWEWSRGLSDLLTERGWEIVHEAVGQFVDR